MYFEARKCDVYDIKIWPFNNMNISMLPYEYFEGACNDKMDADSIMIRKVMKTELKRCASLFECAEEECKPVKIVFDWLTGDVDQISIHDAEEEDKEIIECIDKSKLELKEPGEDTLTMIDSYLVGKKCKTLTDALQ